MTDWNAIQDALAAYVDELSTAARNTAAAADRPRYEQHLAAAARMFAAIRIHSSVSELKNLVEAERRNFGWAYLAGDSGGRAEAAFHEFAETVDGLQAGI
jgi:uncharacterized protein HemX